MKELTRNEQQSLMLTMLLFLKKVCDENKLTLYLCGGSLLGAIRHKGFIPWDDDIDVMMPRQDYLKLIDILSSSGANNKYQIISYEQGNFSRPYAKLIDTYTRVENERHYLKSQTVNSLWIDILPVDGLPDSDNQIIKLYKRVDIYRKMLVLSETHFWVGNNLVDKIARSFLGSISKLFGTNFWLDKIEKTATELSFETSYNVGIITFGLYGIGEKMPKSEFEKKVEVIFENETFSAPSCWDMYLSGIYGDYMTPPPVENRKTHFYRAWII